jgi:geranylgeranyl diphosphate synthase, type II
MRSVISYLGREGRRVDAALRRYLPPPGRVTPTVRRAMVYSLFPGGKRLRPILAIASCRALGGRAADVLPLASALEMIHTYSLIHDDLPALDNDDLRRGRATSHRMFGEAMAILAGDALLTHAFEVAASFPPAPRFSVRKMRAIQLLARAAGVTGMIGGQVMDLEAEGRRITFATLKRIHRGKTGALISAAAQIGGVMADGRAAEIDALREYGEGTGLAFQIIDDVLDLEGTQKSLGKTVGKDLRARKATYPALLGVAASRRRAEEAIDAAVAAAESLGRGAGPLIALARFILERVR